MLLYLPLAQVVQEYCLAAATNFPRSHSPHTPSIKPSHPLVQTLPEGQVVQDLHATAPCSFWYVPYLSPHDMQLLVPILLWYVPAGHEGQMVANSFGWNVPGLHGRHSAKPAYGVNSPGLHLSHCVPLR